MLFWKMFFVASFTHAFLRMTMLPSLFFLFVIPPFGLIGLLFHVMFHAQFIYSAKVEMSSKWFRHFCYNRDPEKFDEYDYPDFE